MSTDAITSTASEAYQAALKVIESVEPRIAAATRKELTDQRGSLSSSPARTMPRPRSC